MPPGGQLSTPGSCAGTGLRRDNDETGAGALDLGKSLRDTAKVRPADVSAGMPGEVHDRGMPDEVSLGDDLQVGALELEGG